MTGSAISRAVSAFLAVLFREETREPAGVILLRESLFLGRNGRNPARLARSTRPIEEESCGGSSGSRISEMMRRGRAITRTYPRGVGGKDIVGKINNRIVAGYNR